MDSSAREGAALSCVFLFNTCVPQILLTVLVRGETLSCLVSEKANIKWCDGRACPCVSRSVAGNLLFIAELVT